MKITISGDSGFLGSHFGDLLSSKGRDVNIFDIKKLKKNKIYLLLKKYKLIKNKNLSIFYHQTKDDKNHKSFIDKETNVIFLEKTKNDIYYKKIIKRNDQQYIRTYYRKFKNTPLDDSQRRVNQFKNFIKNKIIMDFGCGTGAFLFKSQKIFKKGIGIELDPNRIEYSDNKKIDFFSNIKKIKDIDFKFDSIFLFHVLEHLINPDEILRLLKSKLKKNGSLIIEVPHANDLLLKKLKVKSFINFTLWSEHLILHTKQSLKCFLEKAGFKKNKIFFYQRYNLNNHIGWLLYNKPGGHIFFKKKFNKREIDQYNNILIKNEDTDSIYSISKN